MFAKEDVCMILRFAGRQRLEETVQLFSGDREDLGRCSEAHPRKNSQTCLQNIEATLETFRKISTSSCHEIPNKLSNLLAQVATCSTQTVNQTTSVSAEVCEVGLTVIFEQQTSL